MQNRAPDDASTLPSAGLSELSAFWPFIRPYRGRVILAAVILVTVSFILLSLGRGLAWLVDKGLGSGDPAMLDRAVMVALFLALFVGIGSYLRILLVNQVAERVMADIRAAIYGHVLYLPTGWFEAARTGDILSRLNADTAVVQTTLATTLSMAVRNVILLFGGLVLVVLASARMSLVVAVIVPIVVIPLIILARRLRASSRHAQEKLGGLSAEAEEGISAIRTVHAFAQEEQMQSRFGMTLQAALDAALARVRLRAILSGFVFFMMISGVTLILWVGGRDLLAGKISAGDLSAFVFYAFIVASSTGTLSELGGELQRAAGAADRIAQLLGQPLRRTDPVEPHRITADKGVKIRFENVDFAYPSRGDIPALKAVNFTADKGSKLAIVGPSGAGKSTLFHLLLGFYEPAAGQISLNDISLGQMRLADIRRHIAIVPQDPALFSASLAENIAFSRPNASREEIIAAAKQAEADSFITELAQGYDTLVGEKGVRLSGGQRQRIAIARAILCNPDILLLDEATSALDSVSEKAIQEALSRLMVGRTSLVIAHRLSTIMDADMILLMDRGQIIATGTHDNLIKSSPLYQQLAAQQFRTSAIAE
ncbi:MAG: ABC transporter transmembrane domain-containing protein [Candidatus Puniceispirillaceae bacterium]|jgi:ATP-binding cassette subfamily B protein